MDQLNFWKGKNVNRRFNFTISQLKNNAWMCTLTVHDNYKSHSYTGRTTLFIGTRWNTRYKARDMAISLFSSDMEPNGSFSTSSYLHCPSCGTCGSCIPRGINSSTHTVHCKTLDERFNDNYHFKPSRKKDVKKYFTLRMDPDHESRYLDKPILPKRENEEDEVDDVKIINRTPLEEQIFKNELDRELEEYWEREPKSVKDLYTEDLYKSSLKRMLVATGGFNVMEVIS